VRLSYRKRPLATLAATALAVVLPATITVAATSIGADSKPGGATGDGMSINGTGKVIAINGGGFGLTDMTIALGETVSFMNLDAIPHELRLEPATGSSCLEGSMVVWPGVYRACTFTSAGSYTVSDPSSGNATFRTGITVAPASDILSSVVLSPDRPRVVAGSAVTLTGSINIPRGGAQVDIVAKDLSTGVYRKAGQTRTGAAGEFAFTARPTRTTVYFANAILNTTIVTSPMQTVTVTPKGKA
jgi:plastocyanin